MSISVQAFITITIGDQEIKLSQEDAEKLYTELGQALKRNVLQFAPGVRSYTPLMPAGNHAWEDPR